MEKPTTLVHVVDAAMDVDEPCSNICATRRELDLSEEEVVNLVVSTAMVKPLEFSGVVPAHILINGSWFANEAALLALIPRAQDCISSNWRIKSFSAVCERCTLSENQHHLHPKLITTSSPPGHKTDERNSIHNIDVSSSNRSG